MSFAGAVHSGEQMIHIPGAEPWNYAVKLRSISRLHMWLSHTTFPSYRRCLFCTINHTLRILQRPHIFSQCLSQVVMTRDRTCNPPDDRAGTFTTQPIRLAAFCLAQSCFDRSWKKLLGLLQFRRRREKEKEKEKEKKLDAISEEKVSFLKGTTEFFKKIMAWSKPMQQ